MIVPCECGAKLKIDESKVVGKRVKVRCPRCGNLLPLHNFLPAAPEPVTRQAPVPASAQTGALVLIAHDSDVLRNMVSNVLLEARFQVETASNGNEVMKKAMELRPQGIVLDVGLPGIYGFELCERLKGSPETKDTKIILLSSVYDMRRYKRTPVSLYGADDYIEKHHIPDQLVSKLNKLFSPAQETGAAPASSEAAHHDLPEMSRPPAREFESSLLSRETLSLDTIMHEAPAGHAGGQASQAPEIQEGTAINPESISLDSSIFQKEEYDIPKVDAADPEAVEKARRFARIIVSDIALYNQAAVIEGINNGTFYELLRDDVQEGRELYERRVPSAIRDKKDYYQEAFDNFISVAKKKNVR